MDRGVIETIRSYRFRRGHVSNLMGTMLEKSSRKRKIWRYQRPAKCCRATMTRDTTTRATNRILVKQFTSRSIKPTYRRVRENPLDNPRQYNQET